MSYLMCIGGKQTTLTPSLLSSIMAATTTATKIRRPSMKALIQALKEVQPNIKVSEIDSLSTEKAVSIVQKYQTQVNKDKETECYVTFFKKELGSQLKGGSYFVEMLHTCSKEKTDYSRIRPLYRDLVGRKDLPDWARRRELLMAVSAIWRYIHNGRQRRHLAKIEEALECQDCCAMTQKMVGRLKKQGLW